MSFLLCYSPFKPLPLAFFFLILLSFHFLPAISTDFLVGDSDGWSVPKPKEADKYNKWASHNRFNVDDTVRKYPKSCFFLENFEQKLVSFSFSDNHLRIFVDSIDGCVRFQVRERFSDDGDGGRVQTMRFTKASVL